MRNHYEIITLVNSKQYHVDSNRGGCCYSKIATDNYCSCDVHRHTYYSFGYDREYTRIMKRRNFLKMFGLLAVPVTAVASPALLINRDRREKPVKKSINITITFPDGFYELHGKHRVTTRDKHNKPKRDGQWSKIWRTYGMHVDNTDVIFIETEKSTSIVCYPLDDESVSGKFKSVEISNELTCKYY